MSKSRHTSEATERINLFPQASQATQAPKSQADLEFAAFTALLDAGDRKAAYNRAVQWGAAQARDGTLEDPPEARPIRRIIQEELRKALGPLGAPGASGTAPSALSTRSVLVPAPSRDPTKPSYT